MYTVDKFSELGCGCCCCKFPEKAPLLYNGRRHCRPTGTLSKYFPRESFAPATATTAAVQHVCCCITHMNLQERLLMLWLLLLNCLPLGVIELMCQWPLFLHCEQKRCVPITTDEDEQMRKQSLICLSTTIRVFALVTFRAAASPAG